MKRICLLVCIAFFHSSLPVIGQLPLYWQKSFGGSGNDPRGLIEPAADGGYIVAGFARSSDGTINIPNKGMADAWLIKTDSCGHTQWQRTYGGSNNDYIYALKPTPDGGYIFGGATNSNDGDVSGFHGGSGFDSWIVKVDGNGNIVWKRTIGGTLIDITSSIIVLQNNDFIIGGYTTSVNGDLAGQPALGAIDGWIMYLDNSGNTVWQKKFGSSRNENLLDIMLAPDGNIAGCGFMEITTPVLSNDVWIFKMDVSGNLLWSRTYGGSDSETGLAMTADNTGELIVTGISKSSDGDLTVNNGVEDTWTFKTDAGGNLLWQLSAGGNDFDYSWDIITLADQSYIITGSSRSTNGTFTNLHGQDDAFLACISNSGQLLWKQNYGGTLADAFVNIKNTPGGNYIASGFSGSNDVDLTDNYGSADLWVVFFKNKPVSIKDTAICNQAIFNGVLIENDTTITIPVKDICGHDSAYQRYTVDMLKASVATIDDAIIPTGQSITLFTMATGSIAWDSDPTLSCLDCNDPVATPGTTTRYIVTARDGFCVDKDTVNITVADKTELFVPSAFTPNGDGLNDLFMASGYARDIIMQVFNRWGVLVFSTKNLSEGWNGVYKGYPQPAGNYVYLVTYTDLSGQRRSSKGNIILIR